MSCTECSKRAQQGPNYNPDRGTGRTTQRLKTALMAALGGHRVLFVTHTVKYAEELRRYAAQLLSEACLVPAAGNVSATRIALANGGCLQFRGMEQEEPRGMREENKPTVCYWDHFAEEENVRLREKKARMEDAHLIHTLMRKHGWKECTTHPTVDANCELK